MEPWQFELAHPDLVKIGTISLTKLSLGFSAARIDSGTASKHNQPRAVIVGLPPRSPSSVRWEVKRNLQRAAGRNAREPDRRRSLATPPERLPTRVNCFQT